MWPAILRCFYMSDTIAVHCSGNDSLLFQKAPTDKQDYIEFHGEVDDIEDLEDSLQASAVNLVNATNTQNRLTDVTMSSVNKITHISPESSLLIEDKIVQILSRLNTLPASTQGNYFVSDVIALTKPRIKEENLETKRVRSYEIGEAFDEEVLDDETRTQKQKQKRKQLPASVRVNSLLSRIENVLNPFVKYAKQNIIPYINIADDDDDEK
ncbi:unnamed protein product [Didymodactylos carnosus]|uniref:Uncharacterized protein n=1 Tax=Didymodactylos carnosus TaxID=1234261 RepID=A0A814N6A1_9BILA|nr:unnamed protein product [Didymodactylos carnosus]CAF3852825.1 unnamed protein product [Didymodactylos carnosus]